MNEYYEQIKKMEREALIVKHLSKKQANGVDASHETALRKHAVNQQRELLRAYHNYLLQNTDKHECLHTIDEFLEARNSG